MNKLLVVAKYKENVDWTERFVGGDVLIYNKDHDNVLKYNEQKIIDNSHINIELNKYGWEEHTKFLHIINNYHNLPDWTIFTQGNPFDHCRDIITSINNLESLEGYENGYIELSHCEKVMCRWNPPCQNNENDQTETNPDWFINGINPFGQSKSMLLKYFRNSLPDTTIIRPYGMYAVKKENILRHSLEVYTRFFNDKFDPESPLYDRGIRWFLEYGNHLIFDSRYYL